MVRVEKLTDGPVVVLDSGGTAPVVSIHIWLRVGSAMENPETAGMAHFLEHMLFKGAGSHGVGEAVMQVESLGGDINAWTSFESTVLHATVPAERELALLRVLGEMAFEPHLDPVEFERERKVIIEEIRAAMDSPDQILADRQRARAWGDHPYGRPILGTVDSVSRLTRADMQEFHRRHYRAGNAIIVVSGPADSDAVLEYIRETMSDLRCVESAPARTVSSRVLEPGGFAFDGGFEDTSIELAFRIPDLRDTDIPALDLLAAVLGGSRNSILSRELRHERDCVLGAWAELENDQDGGLFVVGAMPRRGRAAEVVEQMVRIIGSLPEQSISGAHLRRARAGVLSDRLRDNETVDGRASRLAWYQACFGELSAADRYETDIRRCRASDLRAVAGKWLRMEHAVIGMVAPRNELDEEGLVAAVARGAVENERPLPRTSPTLRTTTHILDNGLTVCCEADGDAELVGISLMGLGGAQADGSRMPGLGQAWAACLGRGAGDLGPLELASEVEERAGSIQPWAGRSTLGIQLSFPVSELDMAFELLGLLLSAPQFEEQEVLRVRRDLLQAQASNRDDPAQSCWELCWSGLFPGHPWGRPVFGSGASIERVSPGRLRAYHRRVVRGSNLVLGITGAIDSDRVENLARRRLGSIPAGERFRLQPPSERERFRSRPRRTVPREGAPASIVLGFPCSGQETREGVSATVLAALLGGATGGAGRLFDSLRETRGLAYSVGAHVEIGLGGGALFCSMNTDPVRIEEARRGLWAELRRLVNDGVTTEELERVKNSLVDGSVLGLQRTSARADHLAAVTLYGPEDMTYRELLMRPGTVTGVEVQTLAEKILRSDRSVEAIVSPGD